MGMRNTGIIELMTWRLKPVPINSPMVQMTLSMATNIAPEHEQQPPEKVEHQEEAQQTGKGPQKCHLDEHVASEGFLRQRQPG